MTTKVAINEVSYNVRSAQNEKSVKLNNEKQNLKIRKLIPYHFDKIILK